MDTAVNIIPDGEVELRCISQSRMIPDSQYFHPGAFNYTVNLNHYQTMGVLQQQKDYQIKVEVNPEMSFYNCQTYESDDESSSEKSGRQSPTALTIDEEAAPTDNTKKSQICSVCGKILSSPSSYYVHMKMHSQNKPFACTMCEASFCRKPYLEVHMRTHTGERPYQCEVCNKRFTQKSSLNTHKRVHTGERPYSCDICHKKFAVKSYVSTHRLSHVSNRPLACERCSVVFTSKMNYTEHMRTHAARHMFGCRVCGRSFAKESYLIRHHNKIHRENVLPPPPTDFTASGFNLRINSSPEVERILPDYYRPIMKSSSDPGMIADCLRIKSETELMAVDCFRDKLNQEKPVLECFRVKAECKEVVK